MEVKLFIEKVKIIHTDERLGKLLVGNQFISRFLALMYESESQWMTETTDARGLLFIGMLRRKQIQMHALGQSSAKIQKWVPTLIKNLQHQSIRH